MTDRCKNITLPQTSFAGGNKRMLDTKMITFALVLSVPFFTETRPNDVRWRSTSTEVNAATESEDDAKSNPDGQVVRKV